MRVLVLLLSILWALPVLAVQPDEMLADPALESRARAITHELRCVVCNNENVDDSNAEIARDIRLMVRERIVAGDDDAQVVQFMVDRFGEYVLLNPRATGSGLVLWLAGPILLLIGLAIAIATIRRRQPAAAPLSDDEQRRLEEILRS